MQLEQLRERVRADFPALQREVDGRPAAFFDGPAGSQVPRQVAGAVAGYLLHHNANDGGAFVTSEETERIQWAAREWLAALLGAGRPDEVVFGSSMTSLTLALSRSLARTWGPGDEVIVSQLDHQANIAPWRLAARDAGATVHMVPFDPDTATLDYDRLEALLGPRTRLVAVGHASNALGTVNQVERVARLAREAGALSFVDSVHMAPHGVLDVQAIGCDFLACSAYKFFGPHVGVLWGRHELLEELEPYKLPPAPDQAPDRWENGTPSYEGIAGAAAAVEWISGLAPEPTGTPRECVIGGMQQIERLEEPLLQRLLEGLREIPGLRLYGPAAGAPRTPTLAFTLQSATPREVAEHLGRRGIFVWDGDFYASTVIERLGLRDRGGVVRVGLAPYNTPDEVERLLEQVGRMVGRG